jgi:hypothetical protein
MNYPNLLSGGSIKALRIMRKIHEMGERLDSAIKVWKWSVIAFGVASGTYT